MKTVLLLAFLSFAAAEPSAFRSSSPLPFAGEAPPGWFVEPGEAETEEAETVEAKTVEAEVINMDKGFEEWEGLKVKGSNAGGIDPTYVPTIEEWQEAEAERIKNEKLLRNDFADNTFSSPGSKIISQEDSRAQEEAIKDLEDKISLLQDQGISGLKAQDSKTKVLEEKINQLSAHLTRSLQAQQGSKNQESDIKDLKKKVAAQELALLALEQKTRQHSAHCGYQLGAESTRSSFPRAGSTIPYSGLLVDTGVSSLDIATGVWTAGLDGVYQISWSLSAGIESGEFSLVYLARDGARIRESDHFSGSLQSEVGELWDQGGRSLVLGLRRGQTLELRTQDRKDSVYKVTFCVTLLHADQ